MMRFAVLGAPARHIVQNIRSNAAGMPRTLRTVPVVMRQAQSGNGSNLPARSGSGSSALSFPSFGFGMPSRFRDIEQEMDAMLRNFGLGLAPLDETTLLPRGSMSLAVDVKDEGNAFVISADVPGMNKEDIKVEVSPDRILSISGERKSEHTEEDKEKGFMRVERSYGSFARSFRLPDHVDVSGIKAEMNNGVLKLNVPKKEVEETKKQTISIDVGSSNAE